MADEALTYVSVLASVARGTQAYDVSLCLPAGSSTTGLLGTGGGVCNPRGEAEHQECRCLGYSTASTTSRVGPKAPEAHKAGSGSTRF